MKTGLNKVISRMNLDREMSKKYPWGSFWNYRHGFRPVTIEMCGIDKSNYKQFISDRDYFKGHRYNGDYSSIIDNKLWLPFMLQKYKEYLPVYYYYKDKLGFLNLRGVTNDTYREDMSSFYKLLDEQKKLALKHTHSSLGDGFYFVKKEDDQYYINGKPVNKSELTDLVSKLDEYIITEYIQQHTYSREISESSLNTLRLVSVWDEKKRKHFIARAFHRFGCNGSTVDNLSSGNGVLIYMDPETGVLLGNGGVNINNSGFKYKEDIIHPNINLPLKGLIVPNYEFVKNKILQISNEHSYLKFVGWDVAVTENGFKIVEANSRPSLQSIQQRTGFLTDSRIRKVLKK